MKTFVLSASLLVFFIIGGGFANFASAQNAQELCGEKNIQELCQETCALQCGEDNGFLANNVSFCVDNNFVGTRADLSAAKDDASCNATFGRAEPVTDNPEPTTAQEIASDNSECENIKSISKKRDCIAKKYRPSCSTSVASLQGQAELLVIGIKGELDQYGDLLTGDWKNAENREELCKLKLEDLDKKYEIATDNPASLRASQRQAQEIQKCQGEWEKFVRERAEKRALKSKGNVSDKRADTLAREAEEQLAPLKNRIAELSNNIAQLETVAETIIGIVDDHLVYCASE